MNLATLLMYGESVELPKDALKLKNQVKPQRVSKHAGAKSYGKTLDEYRKERRQKRHARAAQKRHQAKKGR